MKTCCISWKPQSYLWCKNCQASNAEAAAEAICHQVTVNEMCVCVWNTPVFASYTVTPPQIASKLFMHVHSWGNMEVEWPKNIYTTKFPAISLSSLLKNMWGSGEQIHAAPFRVAWGSGKDPFLWLSCCLLGLCCSPHLHVRRLNFKLAVNKAYEIKGSQSECWKWCLPFILLFLLRIHMIHQFRPATSAVSTVSRLVNSTILVPSLFA